MRLLKINIGQTWHFVQNFKINFKENDTGFPKKKLILIVSQTLKTVGFMRLLKINIGQTWHFVQFCKIRQPKNLIII